MRRKWEIAAKRSTKCCSFKLMPLAIFKPPLFQGSLQQVPKDATAHGLIISAWVCRSALLPRGPGRCRSSNSDDFYSNTPYSVFSPFLYTYFVLDNPSTRKLVLRDVPQVSFLFRSSPVTLLRLDFNTSQACCNRMFVIILTSGIQMFIVACTGEPTFDLYSKLPQDLAPLNKQFIELAERHIVFENANKQKRFDWKNFHSTINRYEGDYSIIFAILRITELLMCCQASNLLSTRWRRTRCQIWMSMCPR